MDLSRIRLWPTAGLLLASLGTTLALAAVWFTDRDSGFLVLRFTNRVWPFKDAS